MFSLKLFKMCFALLVSMELLTLYKNKSQQGDAQPIKDLKTRQSTGARLSTSITTRTKLLSRTRMFLQIDRNGKVSGTVNCSNPYVSVQLEISSVGTGLVRIKGVKSGHYLGMKSAGDLYSTPYKNEETEFKTVLLASGYHTFVSNKYFRNTIHDVFVGRLRRNGMTKNGSRTNKLQKPVHFLMIADANC
ncbi:fibroblast growth factor 1-like [Actinia tenebrosa]|uniref:Fibroblast growth factor n=1 Tax=Actinia tenebrosa TaxID=6105 RepID=A0A6P8H9A6_ACTTE|nr:fibroblast growth factor 1-like [Actinia tenebrosa]